MSRGKSKLNGATPAMDVSRIAQQFRGIPSSKAEGANSPLVRTLTNADVFEVFQNDILAARKLGLGWQEIADELARAGVHKKNGALFTGPDIRIYSSRKLKDLGPLPVRDRSDSLACLPSPPSKFIVSSSLHKAINQAETLSSALRPPNASGAHDDNVLRMLMRVDAVSSSRMDGLRPSLEDLLEIEARGIGNDSLGRKRTLLSARLYADALEQLIPVVWQAGRVGLTPALIQQLWEAVTIQIPDQCSIDDCNYDGTNSSQSQDAAQPSKPAQGSNVKSFETIARIAQGDQLKASTPALVHIAIAHAQCVTTWHNEKGSGRAGRLFLTLMLAAYGLNCILVSNAIEARKTDYISALRSAQRDHQWEPLVQFLSGAIISAARQVDLVTQALNGLPILWKSQTAFRRGSAAQRALDVLPYCPLLTVSLMAKLLNVNATAANRAMEQLIKQGIVVERKGRQKSRVFSVPEAINIISDPLNNANSIS